MVRVTYESGFFSKSVMIRVHPGSDLVESITDVCGKLGIQSGSILSAIGSLQRASFLIAVPMENKIGAGYSNPIVVEGPLELLSGQGNMGSDEEGNLFIHMHGVLSDGRGNAYGGHLIAGACPVLITSEVMIGLFDGMQNVHRYDPEVELKILTPVGTGK